MDIEEIKQNKGIQELLEFGIINIDKPSGPTSFEVSNSIMKRLKLRKTSHFGTLDPIVTGVLPVALNRACKLTGFFLGADKKYVGIMRIHSDLPLEIIEKKIQEKFVGEITQLPPIRSRVKRQERQREIKYFKILEKVGQDILFEVECEGGTYIRKLVHDIGEELKVGAHMTELRRTQAGIFSEGNKIYPSVNIYDFEKAVEEYEKGKEDSLRKIIIPAEIVSEIYQVIEIKKENLEKTLTGKPIYKKDLIKDSGSIEKGEIISVFCEKSFVGIFKVFRQGELFAKPEFVFN